jgi:cell wall-associated NlpC family hydrolase
MYRPISQKIQGTEYGHSALYVGGGKVIDARGGGTKTRTLASVARQSRILALSPKVTNEERREAVRFAKESLGSPYNILGALRAGTPFRGKRGRLPSRKELRQKALDSGICSGLVAYAYKRLKFSNSSRDLTRPGEILRSGKLEVVGRLGRKNEEYPR